MALIELSVENLAVIERARVTLGPGLTVLTGETGAGKSLVVDALALALGARAASDQVRAGADAARVEAVFDQVAVTPDTPLAELLDANDRMAILRREVSSDGRSLGRVNDRTVTIGSLASLGGRLAEIHGQHEQQRLLSAEHQLELLDRFGQLDDARQRVAEAFHAWRGVTAQSAELLADPHELARRLELLRHEVDEIGAAAMTPGEEVELGARVRAASHAEAVARALGEAGSALTDEAAGLDALRAAAGALARAAADDERLAGPAERAEGLVAEAVELARDVAAAADAVDLDPAARAALEERLALVYELQRKYGESIEAVLAYGERSAAELARLEDQEGLRQRLREDAVWTRAELEAAAAKLAIARAATADELARRVNAELPPLGLPAGSFDVDLAEVEVGPMGGNQVAFTFAPNPGEPPRPLARIASGGEASRLSLALKVVLAATDSTPVLVFDEVDAGVGGRHATALGERLRDLAAYHQVLCVTHLAQVAAFAQTHLHVGKEVVDGRTVATVRTLDGDDRARELAAMLAGEGAGDEAQAAAEALLRSAG